MDLSDPSQLALFTALVGLGGTLVGALIGFLATSYTTHQQIDRQERDVRRAIYGDFLANAATLQGHQSERRLTASQVFRLRDELFSHKIDLDDPLALERFEVNEKQMLERQEHLRAETRRLQSESADLLARLTGQALRLKLVAPELVFCAAHNVVDVLLAIHTELIMQSKISEHDMFGGAMTTLQGLIRADTGAKGAETWSTAAKKHAPSVVLLREHLDSLLGQEPEKPS